MALGRQRPRQSDMVVTWAELPRSPGHIFYDRLQSVLIEAAFDSFVEGLCAPLYAARRRRRSRPPGRYFRIFRLGFVIARSVYHDRTAPAFNQAPGPVSGGHLSVGP